MRYLITLAGRSLTLLMRVLFGIGTPRSLQGLAAALYMAICAIIHAIYRVAATFRRSVERFVDHSRRWILELWPRPMPSDNRSSSTGC